MRTFLVLILVAICARSDGKSQKEPSEEEILNQKYGPVIFANLLFRHGDRTALSTYPNDPNKDNPAWNAGFGQLTKKGVERQLKLGIWIKAHYPDLIGKVYTPDSAYVVSSDSDRTIMSAQITLAGMFPPLKNSKPPFQAIPIHTQPKSTDNMLNMEAPCGKYELEKKKLKCCPYMEELDKKHADLYKNLTNFTGMEIDSIDKVAELYDILKVEVEDMCLKLPDWTSAVYPHPLAEIALEASLSHTYNDEMKKLRAGPLLADMLCHMEKKANGSLVPDAKLWIYSGHDETIVALLHALCLEGHTMVLPSYGSLVALELRKKDEDHYVTVMYKDGAVDAPTQLKMAGCDNGCCTLQKFLNMTEPMLVRDFADACDPAKGCAQLTLNTMTERPTGILMLLGLFFMVSLGAVIAGCCWPKTTAYYHQLHNQLN